MKKILKLTVKTAQIILVKKSIITDPLILLTNRSLNVVFLCIIYCVTNAVAVMYSRNIPMAGKQENM